MRRLRLTLLLLFAIALLISGVGYSLFRKPKPPAVTNSNVNASVTVSLAVEPAGVPVSGSATLAKSTISFVKAYRAKEFRVYTAAEGKEFIVVTFKPLTGDTQAVLAEAKTSVHLVSGTQSIGPRYIDLPSSEVSTADGSFAFEVATGLQNPVLRVGTTEIFPLPISI
jgi:hypothetical protein